MSPRWYQTTVIYSVEVSSFQDSNGDGRGDLHLHRRGRRWFRLARSDAG